MSDKASTAVERALRTQQSLNEKRIARADEVSREAGDRAAGDAMRDALEAYDRANPEPVRMCPICGKHPASEPHPYNYEDHHVLGSALDHVHMTFG